MSGNESPLDRSTLKSLKRMALMSKNYGSHKNLLQAEADLKTKGIAGSTGSRGKGLHRSTSEKSGLQSLPSIDTKGLSLSDSILTSPIQSVGTVASNPLFPSLSKSPEASLVLQRHNAMAAGRGEGASMPAAAQLRQTIKQVNKFKEPDDVVIARLTSGIPRYQSSPVTESSHGARVSSASSSGQKYMEFSNKLAKASLVAMGGGAAPAKDSSDLGDDDEDDDVIMAQLLSCETNKPSQPWVKGHVDELISPLSSVAVSRTGSEGRVPTPTISPVKRALDAGEANSAALSPNAREGTEVSVDCMLLCCDCDCVRM